MNTKSKFKPGDTFGALPLIEQTKDRIRGAVTFRCQCTCGKEVRRVGSGLAREVREGRNPSCGCQQHIIRHPSQSQKLKESRRNFSERMENARIKDGYFVGLILKEEPNKGNNTGHRNVYYYQKKGLYIVRMKLRGRMYSKNFKTLTDAICWRDYVKENIIMPEIKKAVDKSKNV